MTTIGNELDEITFDGGADDGDGLEITFDASVGTVSREANPGNWMCEIRPEVTIGRGTDRPGIVAKKDSNGKPMWSVAITITDDHPLAPRDQTVLTNISWGYEIGRKKANTLLEAIGHPVKEWIAGKTPAPKLTPALFYGRSFVLRCGVSDKGYPCIAVEVDGKYAGSEVFNPYLPAAHPSRGPVSVKARGGPSAAAMDVDAMFG